MTRFHHIFVPTDFGEPANRALEVALGIGAQYDARLTLFHATWIPTGPSADYGPSATITKNARAEFQAAVAALKQRYPRAEGVLASGEAGPKILEFANETGADLIIMGTHGRHGLARAIIGSVAEKIVRSSPIPVLVVPAK